MVWDLEHKKVQKKNSKVFVDGDKCVGERHQGRSDWPKAFEVGQNQ